MKLTNSTLIFATFITIPIEASAASPNLEPYGIELVS